MGNEKFSIAIDNRMQPFYGEPIQKKGVVAVIVLKPLPHLILPPNRAAHALVRSVAEALPLSLVASWGTCGKGVMVINRQLPMGYLPSPLLWQGYTLYNPLCVPPAGSAAELWSVVGAWLNHFGGSWAEGELLTDGQGATPTLQATAERLQPIITRGYATTHLQTDDPATLLARAVAAYHLTPRDLAFADPQLHKWLKHTLFDDLFWQKVNAEVSPAG